MHTFKHLWLPIIKQNGFIGFFEEVFLKTKIFLNDPLPVFENGFDVLSNCLLYLHWQILLQVILHLDVMDMILSMELVEVVQPILKLGVV